MLDKKQCIPDQTVPQGSTLFYISSLDIRHITRKPNELVQILRYGKCPELSNANESDKMINANSADLGQTAPEQFDQGQHSLPFP